MVADTRNRRCKTVKVVWIVDDSPFLGASHDLSNPDDESAQCLPRGSVPPYPNAYTAEK